MAEKKFHGQSYKWPAYTIVCDGDSVPSEFKNVRLLKTEAGNLTRIEIKPDGAWHGVEISYSGQVEPGKNSTGDTLIALSSTGSWSGGSNYWGYVFGKAGAILWFNRKGKQQWLVFTEDGFAWQDVAPGVVATEL